MLRLKDAHYEAFRREALADFEDEMVDHLHAHFGAVVRPMGDGALRALVRDALAGASRRGFSSRRAACKYLNLVVAFGADFETQAPWAGPILDDPSLGDPEIRIDRLADAGVEALERAERGAGGAA